MIDSEPDDPGAPDGGMTAVVEPKNLPAKEKATEKKRREVPKYNVLLWDSDDHSYEYVIQMLRELFGHPPEKCFQLAEKVDNDGRVVVLTTTKEHAELKCDQIHAYGKDDGIKGCKGSMSASIEAVD